MPAVPDSNSVLIRGGRIIDPAAGRDEVADLAVVEGRIAPADSVGGLPTFDAAGLIVCPGLVDIHVHFREPGQEHKEDIQTGSAAAATGGFTTVACMPNTTPAIDTPELVRRVIERAAEAGTCRVLPIAAITRQRAGRQVTDFDALREAGAVAFSDDGDGVEDDGVMLRALERAKAAGATIIQHCEYKSLAGGGVMHAGPTAQALGLPGIDPRAEIAMLERDLELVRRTRARYHAAHVSTAGAVELIRRAKAEGLPVTAEACPHHLLLTDRHCAAADPNFKMNPPLRPPSDVEACIAAVLDGTIDCLVTDHAPHTAQEKAAGFRQAPFGIVGLETSLALLATAFVSPGRLDWSQLIDRMTRKCRSVIGLQHEGLSVGATADLCVIDPEVEWTIEPSSFASRSRNTPFGGRRCSARPVAAWLAGRCTFAHRDYRNRWPAPDSAA
jgi:dihydroorotase